MGCSCHRRAFVAGVATLATSWIGVGPTWAQPLEKAPDTAVAKASEAYLASVADPIAVRHCKRSYQFALALSDKVSLKPDREALYVSCLFHDLGLEPAIDGAGDFETVGAAAAKKFLLGQGVPALADRVAEAIEIHTAVSSANDPRPEVALLHMGTLMDVTGSRIDQIDAKLAKRVVEEFPRAGTKAHISALLKRQIDLKPESRIGALSKRFDILAAVQLAPFED